MTCLTPLECSLCCPVWRAYTIKTGKGALRGMTLSPGLVSEWIDASSITVHVSHNLDLVYPTSMKGQFEKNIQHKEDDILLMHNIKALLMQK